MVEGAGRTAGRRFSLTSDEIAACQRIEHELMVEAGRYPQEVLGKSVEVQRDFLMVLALLRIARGECRGLARRKPAQTTGG